MNITECLAQDFASRISAKTKRWTNAGTAGAPGSVAFVAVVAARPPNAAWHFMYLCDLNKISVRSQYFLIYHIYIIIYNMIYIYIIIYNIIIYIYIYQNIICIYNISIIYIYISFSIQFLCAIHQHMSASLLAASTVFVWCEWNPAIAALQWLRTACQREQHEALHAHTRINRVYLYVY